MRQLSYYFFPARDEPDFSTVYLSHHVHPRLPVFDHLSALVLPDAELSISVQPLSGYNRRQVRL